MSESILVSFSTHEFKELIRVTVREALAEHTPQSSYLDDQPLNIEEAATFVRKPISTMYQLTSTRKIPFSKVGRQLLFFKKDLVRWIEESKKKTKKEIESEGFSMKGGMKK